MSAETLRKLLHVAFGGFAFAAVFLGPLGTAAVALAALAFNSFVLPRAGGRRLWRRQELARGHSLGMLLYPLSVLLLVAIFQRRLEVAAAVWGILAFGDGAAALLGTAVGGARLPWNPAKTWVGTLSHWLFGSLAAAALLGWTLARRQPPAEVSWTFLAAAAAAAALFAAFLESQPQELDDNLGVPLLTALVLFGVLAGEGYWSTEADAGALAAAAGVGLALNLAFAAAAFAARAIDFSGLVAGVLLGTVIYAFLGLRGFLVLAAFLVLGAASTRLGWAAKAALRLAQEAGGRRSARHAVANAGVPATLAVFAATTPWAQALQAGFVAAFASAASDTLESELGQLWGRRTVLVTTFEPVPRGSDGAVSLEGTLAGVAGAAALAVLGWALGFYGPGGIVIVTLAGFLGSVADSLLGAALERRGLLDNEAVNFLSTLAGALVAVGLTLA